MTVNRSAFHCIDNTIDSDLVIDQIGKGSSSSSTITEFKVGNMPRIQVKLLESIVSKISANYFFWVDVVNSPRTIKNGSVFSCNRRLTNTERIGKYPCRHGQGCKNPAQLQLFGFGT